MVTLKALMDKHNISRNVALKLVRMIPLARKEPGGPGQIEQWIIPDDDHVDAAMIEKAREEARETPGSPSSAEPPPSDPALQEEERALRRERLATEKIRAEIARLQAEAELSGIKQRYEIQRRSEEVARRAHRLRLHELADRRNALVQEIRDLEQRSTALEQEVVTAHTHLDALRANVEVDEQVAWGARARRAEEERAAAGARARREEAEAELATVEADLRAARNEGTALKADCAAYVAAARERITALEAEEAEWRAATRAFLALLGRPVTVTGQIIRALMTVAGAFAGTGVWTATEEVEKLAELRRRLLRVLLPEGVGELQAAMEEIAAIMDRRDLSNEQRTAKVSGLARKALARILEQQRGKGDPTG